MSFYCELYKLFRLIVGHAPLIFFFTNYTWWKIAFLYLLATYLHEGIQMHRSGNVSLRYSSWALQIYHSDGDHANKDCRHHRGHRSVN